jgi:hypothetical protein
MIGQCELAVERGKDTTTPIVQMAAVLGVVRHLRTRQHTFAWLPRGERLVDAERAWEFFTEASRCLFAPGCGLAVKAVAEADGQDFDELTAVRGLLPWLALECDVDVRTALDESLQEPEATREKLVGVAYLLPAISQCVEDPFAEDLLKAVVEEAPERRRRSVVYHLDWGRRVTAAFRGKKSTAGSVMLGDIVVPAKIPTPWPLVVVDAQYTKIGVADLDSGEPKYFGTGYVTKLSGLPCGANR